LHCNIFKPALKVLHGFCEGQPVEPRSIVPKALFSLADVGFAKNAQTVPIARRFISRC